ncbi:hypothetical protein [Thiolapillus brandeum]|uniref:hypothetical protein n=1 Tax=Thiolapillus brandeum TaxID=1076588 RepID=UPI000596B84B|nr:hypothetical protein [Thiolapillus brandeum]
MLKISNTVGIPDDEIHVSAIRTPGAGGQNVNKARRPARPGKTAKQRRLDAKTRRGKTRILRRISKEYIL